MKRKLICFTFVALLALVAQAVDYYVDPAGDDAAAGTSQACAWRTLAGAMTAVGKLADKTGVVVHAAPGTYDEGAMWDNTTSNRVIIPKGVGLIADQGARVTKIVGAFDPNTRACGPLATRCVHLKPEAWIRGFTLERGYSSLGTNETTGAGYSGGVFATETSSVVADCEIRLCTSSSRGIAATRASIVRCYVHNNFRNSSDDNNYGLERCGTIFDSYIRGGGGTASIRNAGTIVNSTIWGKVTVSSASYKTRFLNSYAQTIAGNGNLNVTNSVCNTISIPSTKVTNLNFTTGISITNLLDAAYRPKAGDARLIDAGDATLWACPDSWKKKLGDDCANFDFSGGARIVGNAIDIGAGEFQGASPEPPAVHPAGTLFAVHGTRRPLGVDTLVLAEREKPAGWSVVIPSDASDPVFQAASELIEGIRRTTGVSLPLQIGAATGPAIYVAQVRDAQLGEDGFRLKTEGKRLRITGGVRGVLYGVYEFLERFAHCTWVAAWFADYPTQEAIEIPAYLDESQVPAFASRDLSLYFKEPALSAHFRLNGTSQSFDSPHGGTSRYCFDEDDKLGRCHTFASCVKQGKYANSHPEYYSYRISAGGRVTGDKTQLCLTNPDVLEIAKNYVLDVVTNHPDYYYFGVSQNDNENFCQCPNCLESVEKYGHSGTILNFVNPIAAAVKEVRPDAIVETLAYQYSQRPPLGGVVPNDNVMICLCSIYGDFGQPFRDAVAGSSTTNNINFANDVRDWHKISKHLYIWDYAVNFHHYPFPFLNFNVIQPNIQFFYENGVREMLEQGDRDGTYGWYTDLRFYLFSKLLWNPYIDLEDAIDRFCSVYYGSAADIARTDFNAFRDLPIGGPNKTVKIYGETNVDTVPDSILAESTERWLTAQARVANDRPEVQRAVAGGLFAMDYSTVRRYASNLSDALPIVLTANANSSGRAQLEKIIAAAKRATERLENDATIRLSEGETRDANNRERMAKYAAVELPEEEVLSYTITPDKINILGSHGTLVSDVEGSTSGQVIDIKSNHPWDVLQFDATQLVLDENATYNVSVRIRATGVHTNDTDYPEDNYVARVAIQSEKNSSNYKKLNNLTAMTVLDTCGANGGFGTYELIKDWHPQAGQQLTFRIYWKSQNEYTTCPTWDKLEFDSFILERTSSPTN